VLLRSRARPAARFALIAGNVAAPFMIRKDFYTYSGFS
jgi:hypothetical protein